MPPRGAAARGGVTRGGPARGGAVRGAPAGRGGPPAAPARGAVAPRARLIAGGPPQRMPPPPPHQHNPGAAAEGYDEYVSTTASGNEFILSHLFCRFIIITHKRDNSVVFDELDIRNVQRRLSCLCRRYVFRFDVAKSDLSTARLISIRSFLTFC